MWSLAVWPPYDKSNSNMEVDRVQKTPPIKVRWLHTDIRQTNRDKERERDRETERQRQRRDTFSEEDTLFPLPTSFLFTVLHS